MVCVFDLLSDADTSEAHSERYSCLAELQGQHKTTQPLIDTFDSLPREPPLSHSHLLVQHLMKQMEDWQPRQKTYERPEWLNTLIEDVAHRFEPLTGAARVGFECRLEEDAWVVRMYLGATEIVGGPMDGRLEPVNFEVNLQDLMSRFEKVDEFFWSVFPEQAEDIDEGQAYVTVGGQVDGNAVRFHLFAVAPTDVGPGMRLYPNGQIETV